MLRALTIREFLFELDKHNLTWYRARANDRSENIVQSAIAVCETQSPYKTKSFWHAIGRGTHTILKPLPENTRYHRVLDPIVGTERPARFTM